MIAQARRSFGVSIVILLVGFMAIVGALVYRATRDASGPADRYVVEAVSLPQGATLLSAATGEGLITLSYRIYGRTEVQILDGQTGAILKQFAVTSD